MKVVALSDTHMRHADIIGMPDGDMIIHAGDITSYGKLWEVQDFMKWFASLDFKYKIFIAGNHDFLFEADPLTWRKEIPEGIIYLKDESIEIEGMKFYGSPYTEKYMDWAFMKRPGLEMEESCNKIPTDVDVLITHGPPFGILDLNSKGKNRGSIELQQRLKQLTPKVHVFGHIHDSFGTHTDDRGTKFINASLLNDSYRYVNDPVEFLL